MNRFFRELARHFPRDCGGTYTRRMNWGECHRAVANRQSWPGAGTHPGGRGTIAGSGAGGT
jgi:hypothetical protein